MIHNKCGKKVVIDVSGAFKLVSPGINITTKKILPGTMQLDSCPEQKSSSFYCRACNENFETEKEIDKNILFSCDLCNNNYKPSDIYISDGSNKFCVDCLEIIESGEIDYSTPKGKIYGFFSNQSLNKKNLTSLLKIIMNSK